ncbi:O-antigen ligase family protein [Bacteroides cellulosilyticus]|uniref:O-antigen ligase family protein n=1 Tax=Bacteroides cellulosilyticus TaxID=246787 RepID=UPI001C375B5D|nr:O-antigen ligase family protein [Bacteroides cellulosilyticus]MBV3638092.1 O-antigen ligase family protein [Bacteroides cellulosilyticus]MBV3664443.1 O-antigen ligase family protein [Bacteroides cellulosilyticus]MBV3686344.1 O-antigen ligase family protein [Bacteroides cellulosilyticus]MBV3695065.1 O-antigen ligase family protein [Bacteroides cellulosilyticus]MBV3708705.1 O-antigen ligase family protein [Bacteroides cellulosilyticus]
MMKVRIHKIRDAVVVLLQFLAVCALLSLVCVTTPELPAAETIGQWVWFGKVVLFSTGCIAITCLLQIWGRTSWKQIFSFPHFSAYVSWSLILFGGVEAIWGLRQLYGFSASGHFRYALTGSFFNPGPYAGYLAMVLPLCLHHFVRFRDWKWLITSLKIERAAAGVVGVLILCVLPATMSRSAWVAALIGCGWVMYMHRDSRKWKLLWRRYKKRYVSWGIGIFLVLIVGGAGAFFLKPDSALGRLFLWKITCQAIANHPWGCDKGFAFAYGEAQEAYFAKGDYAEWEEQVTGSPEYAFNEYLELTLTQGPAICIMLIVITFACLWAGTQFRRYGVCGAIVTLLVFSFSSYPMHLPAFIVAYVCLLLACGIGDIIAKPVILSACLIIWTGGFHDKWQREKDACRDWVNARILYHAGAYTAANAAYDKLYPQLREKGTFLFEYGHSLHKAGFYNESNKYLDKALVYCADPMILNVIGKNYQALRCYNWAEELLLASVHRLPGRIYPYYLLAKLYAEPEFLNREKFEEMKRIVLMKAPKIHSMAIEEMRREVEEIAKELEK